MQKVYVMRGVNPLARVVEFELLAASEADAKAKAEEQGLKFVVVSQDRDLPAGAQGPQDPPA